MPGEMPLSAEQFISLRREATQVVEPTALHHLAARRTAIADPSANLGDTLARSVLKLAPINLAVGVDESWTDVWILLRRRDVWALGKLCDSLPRGGSAGGFTGASQEHPGRFHTRFERQSA